MPQPLVQLIFWLVVFAIAARATQKAGVALGISPPVVSALQALIAP